MKRMLLLLLLCSLPFSAMSQTSVTVTEGTPALDGVLSADEWTSGSITTTKGVTIQAMADGEFLYIAATWADVTGTENTLKNMWEFDGSAWNKSGNEDRLGIIWDLGLNGADGPNCATMCHGDGLMHTNNGPVDVWHWKAGRGNGMGVVDDKIWKTDDRHSDPGTSAYKDNALMGTGFPTFMAEGDPGASADFLLDGDAAVSMWDPFGIYGTYSPAKAVAFDSTATFAAGAKVPGYVHRVPSGDRASVQAAGKYDNGVWTVEFKRAYVTSSNDFAVTPGGSVDFVCEPFDNEGGSHAADGFDATVYTLDFANIPAQTSLTVTSGTPTIDGMLDQGEWTSSTIVNGKGVHIQAMADAEYLYVAASWTDVTGTESTLKNMWEFDGSAWNKSGNEDRLGIIWDMGLNGADGPNCATMCHGDGLMHTNNGPVDVWHWKAGRGNGMGFVDDKVWKTDDRHSDPGTSAYADNALMGTGFPTFMAEGDPGINADFLLADDAAVTGWDPFGVYASYNAVKAVAFDSTATFSAGAKVPGYVHRMPDGDRASVQSAGKYVDGVWTVEFKRALAGNENDFTVTPGGSVDFVCEPFDNQGGSHAADGFDATVFTLDFSALPSAVTMDNEAQPKEYTLSQNYPNPFNPQTKIAFNLKKSEQVKLSVFNLLGQQVSVLVDQEMTPGAHQVTFDAANLATGVYVYRLETPSFAQTKKMLLVK